LLRDRRRAIVVYTRVRAWARCGGLAAGIAGILEEGG
jgi:hypothetical protein